MATIITKTEREYLLKNMKNLLTEYDYYFREEALNKIIDKWATEKTSLIKAFKKHPNYVKGEFMIAFSTDYHREINEPQLHHFSEYLEYEVVSSMYRTLPDDIDRRRAEDMCSYLPDKLYRLLSGLYHYTSKVMTEEMVEVFGEAIPEIKMHKGEKTSRVVNKICKYLGYDKHKDYNREFAKYADALSPMTIKCHTVLSINPLDYLTMSFGNSWASCHTIDKRNKRGMPHGYEGQYSIGTMSYMLDGASMVFYTVDSSYEGVEFWSQPKINRQMFHWGEEKLIQGRLYPQDSDGDDTTYTNYRRIVQEIMSNIFDFPNLWIKQGYDCISNYVITHGGHYEDYFHYRNCNASKIKGNKNNNMFIIGADAICIECGGIHQTKHNINHCTEKPYVCEYCGRHLDVDERVIYDGRDCCSDCAQG